MPHAIISEKRAELTSAPSFSPPISLLLSDLLLKLKKTPLILILLVSNKTGTNGSWQNMFSVTAEKLLD